MIEIAASILLLVGTAFVCLGAIGLIRLPDVYSRMHAVTKATTLGVETAQMLLLHELDRAERIRKLLAELLPESQLGSLPEPFVVDTGGDGDAGAS